jgi:hypothetical protein
MATGIYTGAFHVLIGSLALIFNKRFAQHVADFQERVWSFKYSDTDSTVARVVIVIVSLAFIIFGVATILGVIPLKK